MTTQNFRVRKGLTIDGTTSGDVSIAAPAVSGTQSYTLPTAQPASNGYVLASQTDGTMSWIDNSAAGTTYTIDASSTTGGADLNLQGSDSTTDTIKFAEGTNITITATDANTITIDGTDTNTTYTIDATSTTGGANLNLVGSDATTDSVSYLGSGATTVTRTDANTITISSTDNNTTYTIDATSTTGGANLNLVGSDSTTDSVSYLGSGATTVTRTDANTITISSTDNNTTYDFNATSTTGGANLNLVGSDATTDTVKLTNGGYITATYTSGTEVTLGSNATDTNTPSTIVARDASGNFSASGATLGNVTVGVATDQTISTTSGDLILTSTSSNVLVTGGEQVSNTLAAGGKALTSGNVLVNINGATNNTQLPTAGFFDNTTANRRGQVVIREFGQNTGTSATNSTAGTGNLVLEGTRASSGGTNLNTFNNNNLGRIDFGGFDNTRWTSENGIVGGSAQLSSFANETFASSTVTITGSITGTTLTVTATTGYVYPGMILSGTNILFGTIINTMGSNTNGGVGTYTVSRSHSATGSQSITGIGSTNNGTSMRLVGQPSGIKLNTTSRQNWLAQSWFPPTTTTINGVTVNNATGNTINLGISDSGDVTLIGSTDNVIYKGRGLTTVAFQGASFNHTGVTDYDAQFSGYIVTNTLTVTSWVSGFISTGSLLTATGIQPATFATVQLTSALAASATTTATGTSGTAIVTVASATGISVGQLVIASGIPTSTFVSKISGTTITLTANLTAPLSATAIDFYVAGQTGTYTVSTTFATGGQTVGSVGTPVAFAATPDNNGLRNSNKWNSYTSRKSFITGRQAPLKAADTIYGFNQYATSDAGFSGFTNPQTGSLTWTAAEDFSVNAVGSEVKLQTANIGTTTLGNRFIATSASATINSDALTLKDSASVNLVGNKITYNRVYGQFQYDTTVTPVAADTAYVFPLGTADINNIATVGSTSRLIAGAAGIYNLQFSVQVDNADNSNDHDAYIWLRKNGTDVVGSMGRTTVTKNNAGSLKIIAWNYIVSSANVTDYWEIAYAVSDTDVTFPAFAATAFGPSTACIITSLTPVGA